MSKQPSILETVLTLGGLLTGGPKGAVIGKSVGTLLGGGTFQDAFSSGLGMLFQTDPRAALAANILNIDGGFGRGDDRSRSTQAAINASRAATQQSNQMNPIANVLQQMQQGGTYPTNLNTILQAMIANEPGSTNNPLTALLASIALNQMTRRKNPFSALEQEQYRTGERSPGYQGTPVPDPRYSGGIRRVAQGGMIEGPGTGKSDSIPAQIYQGGKPVQEARLSNGEFVMTADAVKGAGNGNRAKGAARMYKMMNQFEGRA